MKKAILLGWLLFAGNEYSQATILAGNVNLGNQSAINDFPINHPNCTGITGTVQINGNGNSINTDITNLNGLNGIISIGGDLQINNCQNLTNLNALSSLTSIGNHLYLTQNTSLLNINGLSNLVSISGAGVTITIQHCGLTNLNGLSGITSIAGDMVITDNLSLVNLNGINNLSNIGGMLLINDNPALSSLDGLNNLTHVNGYLQISNNPSLVNLSGLNSLNSIGNYFTLYSNIGLTNLSGLNNLASINGQLVINYNSALTNLAALSVLTSINGQLVIGNSPVLTSLSGLDNLSAIGFGNLTIANNSSLSTCAIFSICQKLSIPGAYSYITGNANGCNNNSQILTACANLPPINWYLDADQDGYYSGNPVFTNVSPGPGYTNIIPIHGGGDCNDNNSTVHPGAIEICGDGIDNDCFAGDYVCTPPIINTVAGNKIYSYTGDSIPAASVPYMYPLAVISDKFGNIYFYDSISGMINKVNPDGLMSPFLYSANVGGMTVDTSGNLYFTDRTDQLIKKVNTSGLVSIIAGTGIFGYNGDGILATNADLKNPTGITVDMSGNIYFTEGRAQTSTFTFSNGNRIRKINSAGIISTIAGNGNTGFSGDGGPATNATMNFPYGIAKDAAGNIFFSDCFNHRIRKINTAGTISTIAGNGMASYNGDGLLATNATLNFPKGICADSTGNIFVTDCNNQRIRKVNTSGIISTAAGNGIQGFYGDGLEATLAEFDFPSDISLTKSNKMYISEANNWRVRVINGDPTVLNLKIFLEGYYYTDYSTAFGMMVPTMMNQGISTNASLTDSIDVILRHSTYPYSILTSQRTAVYVSGDVHCKFPPITGSYYIVIKHRNTVETWSTVPLNMSNGVVNYDFTTDASKVYGSNQQEVDPYPYAIYAFHSGDLNADENIDLIDLSYIETDINNFQYGYIGSDINGDGNVDLLDVPIIETNINNFIYSLHP